MTLKVLLSAMHLESHRYIEKLNITGDAVIINQCDHISDQTIENEKQSIRFICTTDRGLSKSRNLAIKEADNDICILCDNDVVYESNYEKLILDTFNEHPEADIIVFFIERPERHSPIYNKITPLDFKGAMKIFSPEMAFRRQSILNNSLSFNESFGAGAKYGMGEENIFLFEALRKKLTILYAPIKIAKLMDTESTWFKGYTDKFFIDRGAGYYAMSRRLCLLLIFQFAIRKRSLYKKENSTLNAIKMMLKGAALYKSEIKTVQSHTP